MTFQPDFWDDSKKAQGLMKEINLLNTKIKSYDDLISKLEDIEIFIEMALEDGSFSEFPEIIKTGEKIFKEAESFKLETLLSGEYDSNNAILAINSGSGGLEAQDWAEMLLRMYSRWAEHRGFKIKTLELDKDPQAGIKSATLLIEGINAYGYLKSEKGVHRLVRISPYDSSGKRHTSFASIDVFPQLDDETEIEIDAKDLKIDTYRASGSGGQHVNVTDSAIRITHLPTGLVVQCQSERSQHSNRATAMKMLMGRLIRLKEEEKKEKIEDLQGNYSQISWGSQIRSYVFHPYNMIKDHRTDVEVGNVDKIMDGDIDIFINAYLKEEAL